MTAPADILCIGSVHWDVIGRSVHHMTMGSDVAGRIIRLPGGVALNIATTLARFGLRPVLLSALGRDADGEALAADCVRMGLDISHLYRSDDLPTDRYMAIEGANGLIAAIADAHSLEAAGAKILHALTHGPLGSVQAPYPGLIAIDGNLTVGLLDEITQSPAFGAADLRIASAGSGKAARLEPFLRAGRGTIYVNREEAGILCQAQFQSAPQAAEALLARGAARALVTDGAALTCDGTADGLVSQHPPEVMATRVTGAGDTFMAAHIAAELGGATRDAALGRALQAAAAYVSGETPS